MAHFTASAAKWLGCGCGWEWALQANRTIALLDRSSMRLAQRGSSAAVTAYLPSIEQMELH